MQVEEPRYERVAGQENQGTRYNVPVGRDVWERR